MAASGPKVQVRGEAQEPSVHDQRAFTQAVITDDDRPHLIEQQLLGHAL
jgi:hypothetical protein